VIGKAVAAWLERLEPLGIYDAAILHELEDLGITYDAPTGQLSFEGLLVSAERHRPAGLVVQGSGGLVPEFYQSTDSIGWLMTSAAIGVALHRLLWPMEQVYDTDTGLALSFRTNLASIREREDLSYRTRSLADVPYDEPTPTRRSR
jgi:hypothetical protein